ncbi:MAG TPA: response regulator [Trueperaceae bacterium]
MPTLTHTAPTIVVADDDLAQRTLISSLLEPDGYRVITFDNGRDAGSYLQTHTPDLVILDIHMPYYSGLELCDRIKRVPRLQNVPVMILTSADGEFTRMQSQLIKADLMVAKPFVGGELRWTVYRMIQSPEKRAVLRMPAIDDTRKTWF